MKRLLIAILLMIPLPSFCQTLYVSHSGSDFVGTQFVFEFKEAVRRSTSYILSDTANKAITVEFITLDAGYSTETKNNASAISVTVVMDISSQNCSIAQYVIYHNIYMVGVNRTELMSKDLLAEMDKVFSTLRQQVNRTPSRN